MRVPRWWLAPAFLLGAGIAYVAGMWLLPRYGTAALWVVAWALTVIMLAIVILYQIWKQE